MNADILLKYFARISEAPDAIPRLRRFVLDLAVRGKLVEQDSQDEPASELLKRIQADKARLVKEGLIRKQKPLQTIGSEEVPSASPPSWKWERLGNLSTLITKGSTPTSYGHAFTEAGINFIKVESIKKGLLLPRNVISFISTETHNFLGRSQLEAGDILFSIAGSIGTCAVVTEDVLPANTNQALAIIRGTQSVYDPAFLLGCIQSSVAQVVLDKARGGAMNNVSLEDIQNFIVPLPPLAEQQRIVAKVDELMALCDQLEAARNEREARRQRLTAASLQRLNQPADAASLRTDARFHLDNLTRLTTRPEQIKLLRQTILNLAVRGCLVAQDPQDEPAAKLLGNRQLFPDLEPWEIPLGWAWSSFGLIGQTLGGGTPSKADPDFWNGSIPWVSPKDMKVDVIEDAQDHISEAAVENSATRIIPLGSLLMVVRGMILGHSFPTALTAVPVTINQDMKAIVPFHHDLLSMLMLLSKGLKPEVLRLVQHSTHGTCKLLTGDLFSLPIPIPPLAEQHRIVARVDELMALCDQLEAQLTTTATDSRRLLEAVLRDTIRPQAQA